GGGRVEHLALDVDQADDLDAVAVQGDEHLRPAAGHTAGADHQRAVLRHQAVPLAAGRRRGTGAPCSSRWRCPLRFCPWRLLSRKKPRMSSWTSTVPCSCSML